MLIHCTYFIVNKTETELQCKIALPFPHTGVHLQRFDIDFPPWPLGIETGRLKIC